MSKRFIKSDVFNSGSRDKTVLDCLIEDPTRSVRDIAKELRSYRQKVWRIKTKMEKENLIWGYTAVVDETKMNNVVYIALLKLKPMNEELANLMIQRMEKGEPQKQKIRLTDVLYVNGEYDLMVKFSAPDHATARRYYNSLRLVYSDFLLEKPVIIDVNFSLVREGKMNPEIKRLHEFVPI
jgi:DNA-binding Lrp family transcriptional regulator